MCISIGNHSKISNIIWDWNGTLMDDLELCIKVMNVSLAKRNMRLLTKEYYREIFDFPVEGYYQRLGFDFANDSFEKLSVEFIGNYNQYQYESKLFDKTESLLSALKNKGVKMYILSARDGEQLKKNLEHYKVFQYFEDISGLKDIYAHSKVENGLQLIENQKIKKDETVMIGDTIHDAEVAKKLGVNCVLLNRGHQNNEKLIKTGFPVYENFEELFKNLQF